jgi:transposase
MLPRRSSGFQNNRTSPRCVRPTPRDFTDEQWETIQPLISPPSRVGRPRTVAMRAVLNPFSSLDRSGCQGDMVPHDRFPKSTVDDCFAQGRDDGT